MNPRLSKSNRAVTPATVVGVPALLATLGFACIGLPGDPGSDPCEWEKPEIPHSEVTTPYQVLSSSKVASGPPLPEDRELIDSGLNLMVENAWISGTRFGFSGYQSAPAGEPAKIYLQHLDTLSTTVKETEADGTTHVCGTYSETVKTVIDPAAGTQKVTIDRLAPFDQVATSVVSMTGRKSPDGDIVRTEGLSVEHTVADLKARVEAHDPFNGTFPNGLSTGYSYSLNAAQTGLSVSMCRFKWKWGADVTPEQRYYPPVCIVRFSPADDPATPVNESLQSEIVDTIYWSGWKTHTESEVHEISPFEYKGHVNGTYRIGMEPLSFGSAPEVVAVNSDFDEGRIDPATGYAIPDCDDMPGVDPVTGSGNTQLQLDAVRNHLDGHHATGADVTADLSPNWFGVSPGAFDDEFWQGATVKIRKINKTDSDTGQPESGQVRFYAVWDGGYYGIKPYDLQSNNAVDLVSGGVNGNGSSVYGSGSTIPEDAVYYMEGVRPGKITLECHIKRGDLDEKFEQTFLVATEQSKGAWLAQVHYQIKLQTKKIKEDMGNSSAPALQVFPIDMTQFNPSNGFFKNSQNHNYAYIMRTYYYYQQMFRQSPENMYWAGMAKTAGASVYAGMGDMHIWWHTPMPFGPDAQTKLQLDKIIDGFLVTGNKDIFNDTAWSHHAYISSGIWALRHVQENQSDGEEPLLDFEAWEEIAKGIRDNDLVRRSKGNRDLLWREQSVTMQPLYDAKKTVWVTPHSLQWLASTFAGYVAPTPNASGEINMDEAFSLNAKNPIDKNLGPTLHQAVPGASLGELSHRWAWVENPSHGMLQIWMGTSTGVSGFDATKRANHNNQVLYRHALQYSLSGDLPPE